MPLARRAPFYLALLISGLSVGVTIRYNSFVPIYSDPSVYLGSGQRWADGVLFRPDHFQFLPTFPNRELIGSPFAYRPGAIPGTTVVEVPPGMGILLAAAMRTLGELGAHIVGPLFGGILALASYGVAAMLAGPWAGVLAALLVTTSPITIRHSLWVSNDVPTTALWVVAWLMSLSRGAGAAAAAGAAVTAASMIRPNTAPLAAVIGSLVLFGGVDWRWSPRHWQWRQAFLFAALSAAGPLIVLWANAVQYGNALQFNRAAETFFKWAHVGPNLRLYPAWLIETHSVAAFLGFAAVPVAVWRARTSTEGRKIMIVALSAFAVIAINYGLYVAYINFDSWTFLRFVLPGVVVLFILLAALVVWIAEWLARASRWLAPLALIPVAVVIWKGMPFSRVALSEWPVGQPVLLMGNYLRAALPRDAVIMCYMHCGPAIYYTDKPIFRLDTVAPEFDAVIERVQRQKFRPVLILDEVIETRERIAALFPGSEFTKLDWTPRAAFRGIGRIWYYDPAERQLHQAGVKYPVDILPQP